jgi:hypothetical protein
MSIPVPIERLAQTRAGFGLAVLICPRAQGWAQVLVVDPVADGLELLMALPGSARTASPEDPMPVTVVWTGPTTGDHALVVDGWGMAQDDRLRVRVHHAVLHAPRPG